MVYYSRAINARGNSFRSLGASASTGCGARVTGFIGPVGQIVWRSGLPLSDFDLGRSGLFQSLVFSGVCGITESDLAGSSHYAYS